jgi:hypothetical protein
MDYADVKELHYITPIETLPSIFERGILSHQLAKKIVHQSVAMEEIQDRRKVKVVPGGRPLHKYVNLYFDARNPMLYKRRDQHLSICVLRIDPTVMELPEVVITDSNASSGYDRFAAYPEGLCLIDKDIVHAEYWTHSDQILEWEHKAKKCAEVLVPDKLDASYILGASTSCTEACNSFLEKNNTIPVIINAYMFFR